jgi:hypothetical protein
MRKKLVGAILALTLVLPVSPAFADTEEISQDKEAQLEANELSEARALWIWNATVANQYKYTVAHNEWVAEQQRLAEEQERIEAEQAAAEAASVAPTVVETTETPAPTPVASGSVWDALAACESGGNWSINTGNGYYGGLQFSLPSWQAVGGTGLPSDASREEQIARAEALAASGGGYGHWPSCSAQLGLG